jgi:hypothetical protein
MMQALLGLPPDRLTDDGWYGAWHQRALSIPAAFAVEVLSFIDRKKAAETAKAMADATLESLIAFGVIKAPFELERDYKGAHLTVVVEQNGKVMFADEAYDSLSTAGGMARKQVIGAPPDRPYPQTNGWTFWQYRDDNGDLQELQVLRKSYLERAKGRQRA